LKLIEPERVAALNRERTELDTASFFGYRIFSKAVGGSFLNGFEKRLYRTD
jgi:hypothetical protein